MRFCLISLIASALHLLYQLLCTFEDGVANFVFETLFGGIPVVCRHPEKMQNVLKNPTEKNQEKYENI